MHHFDYRNGVLHAEGVSLASLAETVGTPFYCYSTATLQRHYRVLADALKGTQHRICYAIKANSNLAVIRTLAALGAGADIVSEGEMRRALAAGIPSGAIGILLGADAIPDMFRTVANVTGGIAATVIASPAKESIDERKD